MILQRMPQWKVGPHLVAIASTDLLMRQVPGGLEFGHYPLSCALGYPDPGGYLAKQDVGIFRDAEQHVSVIREKGPRSHTGIIRQNLRDTRVILRLRHRGGGSGPKHSHYATLHFAHVPGHGPRIVGGEDMHVKGSLIQLERDRAGRE